MLHSTYLTRRPLLESDVIFELYEQNDPYPSIIKLMERPEVREAILLASPDLFAAIDLLMQGKPVKSDVLISVTKYILRMSSRPMPFGLFAGLAVHRFQHDDYLTQRDIKDVRVSLEWYMALCEKIEQQQQVNSPLLLQKSHLLQEDQHKVYLYIPHTEEQRRVEIKKNAFLSELMRLLREPMEIRTIVRYFCGEELHRAELVLKQLKNLLKHNVLISHLRPNILNSDLDYFERLFAQREIIGDVLFEQLSDVQRLLQTYQAREIGEGISVYQSLIKQMQAICSSSRYIVVDLLLNEDDFTPEIDETQVQQLIRDLSFLTSFQTLSEYHKAWDDFQIAFLNQYGLFCEVRVVELIDQDFGIGIPSFQQHESRLTESGEAYSAYLISLIQDALLSGSSAVRLSEEHISIIKKLLKYDEANKIDCGLDVKFSILHEDGEKKYVLMGNSFGSPGGSFRGRFRLPRDQKKKIVPYRSDDEVCAEIHVIPNNRYKDLGVSTYEPDYQIVFNTVDTGHPTLPLDDLVMGMDESGLYLKSRTLNKKVLPVSTHMLFYSNFNEDRLLLFLSLFGRYKSRTPADFHLALAYQLHFVPRIEYKNIILSLKRWNINVALMKETIKQKKINETEYVAEWLQRYRVDQYVYILKGDMTLPVKTDTALGIQLIVNELKSVGQYPILTLLEAPELNEKNKKGYFRDYIITSLPQPTDKQKLQSTPEDCWQEQADYDLSWVYFNIYYRQGKREQTLSQCLHLLQQHDFEHYFYLFYLDEEGEHIRIRFQTDQRERVIGLKTQLNELVRQRKIRTYTEALFLPEYLRYGGPELSPFAYEIFCLESRILHLYQASFCAQTGLEKGVIVGMYTLMDLFADYESALIFLNQLTGKKQKSTLKQFRSDRQKYIRLGEQALTIFDKSDPLLLEKREKTRAYVKRVQASFSPRRQQYILSSLIHMTMNRSIGIDRNLERQIYDMLNYTFYNMRYQLVVKGRYQV